MATSRCPSPTGPRPILKWPEYREPSSEGTSFGHVFHRSRSLSDSEESDFGSHRTTKNTDKQMKKIPAQVDSQESVPFSIEGKEKNGFFSRIFGRAPKQEENNTFSDKIKLAIKKTGYEKIAMFVGGSCLLGINTMVLAGIVETTALTAQYLLSKGTSTVCEHKKGNKKVENSLQEHPSIIRELPVIDRTRGKVTRKAGPAEEVFYDAGGSSIAHIRTKDASTQFSSIVGYKKPGLKFPGFSSIIFSAILVNTDPSSILLQIALPTIAKMVSDRYTKRFFSNFNLPSFTNLKKQALSFVKKSISDAERKLPSED